MWDDVLASAMPRRQQQMRSYYLVCLLQELVDAIEGIVDWFNGFAFILCNQSIQRGADVGHC